MSDIASSSSASHLADHPGAPHEIVLTRGRHRWIFRCDRGCEQALVERLTQIADDPECPLDAHDAAIVALVLEQRTDGG